MTQPLASDSPSTLRTVACFVRTVAFRGEVLPVFNTVASHPGAVPKPEPTWHLPSPPFRVPNPPSTVGVIAALALAALASPARAQTDYYNTDAGRPIRIEDAYPVERRAFEVQAAPLRLERSSAGVYHWGIEPELAYGILPRTQVEIGFPLAWIDAGAAGRTTGLAGIELSALHNLNVETAIPALGIAASVLLPAGGLGPEDAYASVKGIMTRTFRWARFHVNGEYTFGDEPEATAGDVPGVEELSRWMAGVAVDRTFPLRSMLITAEVFALEPMVEGGDVEWNTGAGVRYQLSPRWAVDGGAGRRLTGGDRAWYITFGSAYAFGLRWSR